MGNHSLKHYKEIKPLIFKASKFDLASFKKHYPVYQIIDTYELQLKDLFLIRNPRFKFEKDFHQALEVFLKKHKKNKKISECGNWVYFPWNKTLIHYLDHKLHQEVRTARNKNIISQKEQEKFYNIKVGIAGLSVGSNIALVLALMGGARYMKLADPDTIDPSNLNRMIFDFSFIGLNKTEAVARFIYKLNPYAKLKLYREGINENNLNDFLDGIDILVEELDDLEMKVKIREACKKRKIPVIMLTDNGDNVIVDIERFDINPKLKIFHGNLENFDITETKRSIKKLYEAMARIIRIELVPSKVLESVLKIGKTLYSWPQLVTAAVLSGAVGAYVIRKIALGEPIKQGKLEVNIDKILDPSFPQELNLRKKVIKKMIKILGLNLK